MRFRILPLFVLACVACGEESQEPVDSGTPSSAAVDAGENAVDAGVSGSDAGIDAGIDAGVDEADAGVDTTPDAGTPPGVTEIEVAITNSKSQDPVCVAVFADGVGFPDNAASAVYRDCIPFAQLPARITGLREGTRYGVSVFVDADGDKSLDTNAVSMPTEGFGFSNNPTIGFSSPTWNDVSFTLGASTAKQSIKIVYCSILAGGCK